MSNGKGLSTVLAEWAQVASALIGVFALGAAVFVGQASLDQAKIQRQESNNQQTLAFFASFNSENMLGTRDDLDNEDWCMRYYRDQLPPSVPPYQSAVSPSDIVSLVDFFDAVDKSCPASSPGDEAACDRAFTQALFTPYASDLYDNLSHAILEKRAERHNDSFGQGMANLAGEGETPIAVVVARYAQESCGITSPR